MAYNIFIYSVHAIFGGPKMPNPYGNHRRCREHNNMAARDGYCKKCRPEPKIIPRFRNNFIDDLKDFKAPEEIEAFGTVKDEFGINGRWG